jgi:branched-chain amino acid transport system substrate-binding protein
MKIKKVLATMTAAILGLSLLAGLWYIRINFRIRKWGEIKVGGLFELSGGVAEFGQKGLNGMQLAIEQQNAKGGLLGKQLKVISADN